jgi:hypothetical protein
MKKKSYNIGPKEHSTVSSQVGSVFASNIRLGLKLAMDKRSNLFLLVISAKIPNQNRFIELICHL